MLELTQYGICSSDGQQNKDGEISVPSHRLLDKHCPGIHVDLSIKVITFIKTVMSSHWLIGFITKHVFFLNTVVFFSDFIALVWKIIVFRIIKQKEVGVSPYGDFSDDVG